MKKITHISVGMYRNSTLEVVISRGGKIRTYYPKESSAIRVNDIIPRENSYTHISIYCLSIFWDVK